MFIKTSKQNGKIYAAVVKSIRKGNKVNHETVAYLGIVEESQIPYLKAAYSKIKPKLLYKDGTVYDPEQQ